MFKIIMPVYNAEEYLEKAVDSIINQTLSFKDNVVIHLIDDSSSDGSLELCNKYKEQYPDNFIVTHFEENQGVSAVRNYGIKMCKNEKNVIVGFVDSDDYLDNKALETVWNFFENHKDIQLVTSEIYHFGARNDEHKSNWRFEEREVVNIKEDFNYPQYYIGGVFLKDKALRSLKFDVNMDFWEDAMAINKVILKLGKYGLAKGAIYYYRKMENESSLVDKAWRKKERYTTFLEDGYKRLMKFSLLRKFKVVPYIQYVVAYHLRLFLLEGNREVVMEMVPEEEMQAFKDKEGYYYAPIYSEVTGNPGEMNKWGYRVDPSTAGQRLANKKENYDDVQSYQLNAHQGLKIVKEYTTEEDVPVTLCSLADFYAAVSGNTGYIRQFTDSAMVDKVNGILNGDNIVMIEVSGLATSQDNNKKQEVGVERNERLATDRATSVMNWMKQMDCFKDADNKFIMQKGSNLVKKVKDKSVNSLDSKLNRSARVRIIYTYTR